MLCQLRVLLLGIESCKLHIFLCAHFGCIRMSRLNMGHYLLFDLNFCILIKLKPYLTV